MLSVKERASDDGNEPAVVVRADLESLVAPHDETNFLRLFVFEESYISSTSFLPFRRVGNESEELGAPVIIAYSVVESGGKEMGKVESVN